MTTPRAVYGSPWTRLASALFLSAVLGCSQPPLPVTQVVVVVGGDPRIDELEITVRSANARNFSESRRISLQPYGAEPRRLPTSFTLVPADQDEPEAERFRLVVTGLSTMLDTRVPLVRSIVIAGFTAQSTTMLPVVLSEACAGETCRCDISDETCPETCTPPAIGKGAACVPVPEYARLGEVSPGQELEQLARGAGGCNAGEVPDAEGRCADFDECAFGADVCDLEPSACENIVGGSFGYRCQCPNGFEGDGAGPSGCR